MGVSDLRVIPEITGTAVSRLRHRGCEDDIDPYVLLAWQQMCERLTENALTAPVMDIQKLGDSLPAIKHLMLYKESELPFLLGKAFAACGIAFRLVPPFEGAPVRGFVRKFPNGRGMLCLTARKERQDVFWFALFREISRIVNGNANFVDFSFKNPAETYVEKTDGTFVLSYAPSSDKDSVDKTKKDVSGTIAVQGVRDESTDGFLVIGGGERIAPGKTFLMHNDTVSIHVTVIDIVE